MGKIEFPEKLKQLLEGSHLEASIRALADRTGEILADNKLPFFPDYTDHGIDHINCVLKSQVELVPKAVWSSSTRDSNPRLLCDVDAVVIIGATLLHDIAMHIRPDGFLELVGQGTRFQPLPWFDQDHEGHKKDRPWPDLWDDYVREARRLSERDLAMIVGEQSARGWKFHELPIDKGRWERNHCLIIGEFLRRHHARLAHEIAMYGFPGLKVGSGEREFPAMGTESGHSLRPFADLIGLTARSHGTSLRVCQDYIASAPSYPRTPKPMGTAVLYPMALLRVADYLQLDRKRAPAVLLQLRNPQSPISVQEWTKHNAIQHIGPADDPRGLTVTIGSDLSLTLYLQLRDLLSGLQTELDHSTAVLDEAYGNRTDLGLCELNLAIRRVHSNLHQPNFRTSLPFVPESTGFSADPNLLSLLVKPLYGDEPSVGVRELTQNAVDAVCELEAWCNVHGKSRDQLDLPDLDCDVLIEFIKRNDGSWYLRVQDRGIGMNADTIQNYFLRAGASYRNSPEWAKEFVDDGGQPRVARAGRFGIGVFAIFLLGEEFRLSTRHVDAEAFCGYTLEASANSGVLEVSRAQCLKIGTTIEIDLDREFVQMYRLEGGEESLEGEIRAYRGSVVWFCWDWPKVKTQVVWDSKVEVLDDCDRLPIRNGSLSPEWSVIYPAGYKAVYWSYISPCSFSCNGIEIYDPRSHVDTGPAIPWPDQDTHFGRPCIAVLDDEANLPLDVQRYGLAQESLSFIDELMRDIMLSYIAHCLVCGPNSLPEALSTYSVDEFQPFPYRRCYQGRGRLSSYETIWKESSLFWCGTKDEMVPRDPWLYTLLNVSRLFLFGTSLNEFPNSLLHAELVSGVFELPTWQDSNGVSASSNFDEIFFDKEGPVVWLAEKKRHKRVMEYCGFGLETFDVDTIGSSVCVFSNNAEKFSKLYVSKGNWQRSTKTPTGLVCFEANQNQFVPSIDLGSVVSKMHDSLGPNHIIFAAETAIKFKTQEPTSLVAKTWQECLGARAIPFDSVRREALIEIGREHAELKRHIEAWAEMRRKGLKWGRAWDDE